MNKTAYIFIVFSIMLYALYSKFYDFATLLLVVFSLLNLVFKFSKTVVILETISLYSCLVYLVGPYLGYKYFNNTFDLAVISDFVMPVSKDIYFGYAFPAISLFIIGLHILRSKHERSGLLDIIKRVRSEASLKMGYKFIITGILAFYFLNFAPVFLQYVGTICFLLIFAGIAILYFSQLDDGIKNWVLIAIILWLVVNGIRTTMFTIVFYMGVTMICVLFIGKNYLLSKKIIGILLFLIITITLQFTKTNLRTLVRSKVIHELSISTFATLYYRTITNLDQMLDVRNVFPLHLRFNNGFYLGLVMKRFPKKVDFDGGAALSKTIAASFVPRAFWPNKPTAGGIFNAKYYMGITIRHTVNVGPIGEAYGSFGRVGGIIYMFCFGLFLGFAHDMFLRLARKKALLFVFMPMIFYETLYCMENDTMQALNSLIKISLFLFIAFKLFPGMIRPQHKEPGLVVAT